MKIGFAFLLLAFFLVAAAALAPAWGATYYVATTGSDRNDGSQDHPWLTIQHAADFMNPGDTVLIGDGIYYAGSGDAPGAYVTRGGSAGQPITFRSLNKWGARLNCNDSSTAWFYVSADYITIENFEIYGGTHPNGSGGIGIGGTGGIVRGNWIHDIGRIDTATDQGQVGIGPKDAVDLLIERNIIHDIGRLTPPEGGTLGGLYIADHGIYSSGGANITIRNNIFYNCQAGWSIQIYPHSHSNLTIINNTFYGHGYNGLNGQPGAIVIAPSEGGLSTAEISNNIFYDPAVGGIYWYSGIMSGVTVRNNLTYNGTVTATTMPSGVTESGNINNTDPKFVNLNTHDLHLQSGSPAINAGVALSAVTTDFDSVSRPQGSAYDIGAYEYAGTGLAPSPPKNLKTR